MRWKWIALRLQVIEPRLHCKQGFRTNPKQENVTKMSYCSSTNPLHHSKLCHKCIWLVHSTSKPCFRWCISPDPKDGTAHLGWTYMYIECGWMGSFGLKFTILIWVDNKKSGHWTSIFFSVLCMVVHTDEQLECGTHMPMCREWCRIDELINCNYQTKMILWNEQINWLLCKIVA